MATMEQFDRWAQRAAGDAAPEPDVTAAVMRRIAQTAPEPEPAAGGLSWALCGAMACAATVCAVLGAHAWTALNSPMGGLMQQFTDWRIL